ncbi:hypothetical protein RSAG8_10847, partial [Rhizoctonia solani AG-8 WAC10335]
DARCWEHVIGPKNVRKIDEKKRRVYEEEGMFLEDVAEFCKPCKVGKEETFVLQNEDGISFAFEIVENYPAGTSTEEPNDKYDLMVVHAVPVDLRK